MKTPEYQLLSVFSCHIEWYRRFNSVKCCFIIRDQWPSNNVIKWVIKRKHNIKIALYLLISASCFPKLHVILLLNNTIDTKLQILQKIVAQKLSHDQKEIPMNRNRFVSPDRSTFIFVQSIPFVLENSNWPPFVFTQSVVVNSKINSSSRT